MVKLTVPEILALASFDPEPLPELVKSAMGKLMQNYAAELDRNRVLDATFNIGDGDTKATAAQGHAYTPVEPGDGDHG